MSDTQKVAYNTIVQIIARVVTTLASLVAIGYLARYLGVEGYGQLTLIITYLALFGVVADFGFFLLQVREITQKPEQEDYIAGNIFGLKLVLSVIIFTAAYLTALFFYGHSIITNGILIGIIMQTAAILSQVPVSMFQTHLQMQKVAVTNVVSRVLYLLLIIWGVSGDIGLLGMVWVMVVANVAALVFQMAWAWRIAPIVPQGDLKYWRNFLIEAWPIGVVVVLATIYFRIDTIMLSVMKGDYEVGVYGAPYKIIEVMLTVPTIFMTSVFPVITKALSENWERARQIFRKSFDFMALVALPLGFGVVVVGTPVMVLIAGSDFAASGPVLKLLIWATVISFFGGVLNYSIIAAGKQRLLVWPYLLATTFNVVTNLIMIPRFSYTGAAITTVATELLVFGCVMVMTYRWMKLTPTLTVFTKSLVSAGVMFGVLYWAGLESLWLNIVLGALIYGVGILATRAIDKNIVRELFRLG